MSVVSRGQITIFEYHDGVDGIDGSNGSDAVVYFLEVTPDQISRSSEGSLSSSNITVKSFKRVGNSTRLSYDGRIKIYENLTLKYSSSSNESSKTFTVSSAGVKSLQVELYSADSFSSLLDSKTVLVIQEGFKGDTGVAGAVIRQRGFWDTQTSFVNDSSYIDVVLHNSNTYKCAVSHISGSTFDPTKWVLANELIFIATQALIADNAQIKVLGSGAIIVGDPNTDNVLIISESGFRHQKSGVGMGMDGQFYFPNGFSVRIGDIPLESYTDSKAQNVVDNLEIGGTNLFGFHKNIAFNDNKLDKENNGYIITYTDSNKLGRIFKLGFNGVNGDYSVSCWLKAETSGTIANVNLCDVDSSNRSSLVTLTTEYQKFEFIFKNVAQYTSGDFNGFLDIEGQVGTKVYVKDLMIEKGNKPSAYSPAPEDVKFNIDNIEVGTVNIANKSGGFTTTSDFRINWMYNGKWDYFHMTEEEACPEVNNGKLKFWFDPNNTTERTGMILHVNLEVGKTYSYRFKYQSDGDFDVELVQNWQSYMVGKYCHPNYREIFGTFEFTIENFPNAVNGDCYFLIENASYRTATYVEVESISIVEGNRVPSSWSPSLKDQEESINNKIDAIDISGENLIQNSGNFISLSNWQTDSNSVLLSISNKNLVADFKSSARFQVEKIPLRRGKTYTLQIEYEANGNIWFEMAYPWSDYMLGTNLKAGSNKYTTTFQHRSGVTGNYIAFFRKTVGEQSATKVIIKNIMIVEGTKITDWSPSKDDRESNVNLFNTRECTFDTGAWYIDNPRWTSSGFKVTGRAEPDSNCRLKNLFKRVGYYTVSFKAKCTKPQTNMQFDIVSDISYINVTTEFNKFTRTVYISNIPSDLNQLGWKLKNSDKAEFEVSDLMVEYGIVEHPFSVAPESISGIIDNTENKIRQTGIDIDSNTINLKADKVTFSDSYGGNTDKISINPETGGLKVIDGEFTGLIRRSIFKIDSSTINDYLKVVEGVVGVQINLDLIPIGSIVHFHSINLARGGICLPKDPKYKGVELTLVFTGRTKLYLDGMTEVTVSNGVRFVPPNSFYTLSIDNLNLSGNSDDLYDSAKVVVRVLGLPDFFMNSDGYHIEGTKWVLI